MESTTAKGTEFEYEVARVYRDLGYTIEHNVTSGGGKQTDLVATRSVPGSLTIRLFIECKAYEKASLTVDHVRKFQYDFSAVAKNGEFTGGILVSKHQPSRNAREAITDLRCKVISFSQLFDESLNVSSQLKSFISHYKKEEIYDSYISLKQKCENVDERSVDLEATVTSWIDSEDDQASLPLLVILGDFGTGKTTFLHHLKKSYAEKYLDGSSTRIPILLSLRNYGETNDIEKFVETQLQSELDVRLSFATFLNILRSGKLILLLDGFDEMSQKVDANVRKQNFRNLLPILQRSKNSILTCRPSYFVSHSELTEVFGYLSSFFKNNRRKNIRKGKLESYTEFISAASRVFDDATSISTMSSPEMLNISPFSQSDIDTYVRNFEEKNGIKSVRGGIRDRIKETYDLEDLAKRPVLLNLIVKTLPKIPNDIEASPSVIYENYTEEWMVRDYIKGEIRRQITPDDKRSFMELLAWELLSTDKFTLTYEELVPLVNSTLASEEANAHFLATDIQACSFLQRDFGYQFRFAHRSFLEYFVATRIKKDIISNKTETLEYTGLTDEVSFFVGDMIHHYQSFETAIGKLFKKSFPASPVASQEAKRIQFNLLKIFADGRCDLPKHPIRYTRLDGLKFFKNRFMADLRHCEMQAIEFLNCKILGVSVWECKIRKFLIQECILRDIRLVNSNSVTNDGTILISQSTINNLSIEGKAACRIEHSNAKNVFVNNEKGAVWFVSMKGLYGTVDQEDYSLVIRDSTVSNFTFTGYKKYCDGHSIQTKNHGWEKYSVRDRKWSWTNSKFSKCLFFWFDFCEITIDELEFDQCIFICCRFDSGSTQSQGAGRQDVLFRPKKATNCKYYFSSLSLESHGIKIKNYKRNHLAWEHEKIVSREDVSRIKNKISEMQNELSDEREKIEDKIRSLKLKLSGAHENRRILMKKLESFEFYDQNKTENSGEDVTIGDSIDDLKGRISKYSDRLKHYEKDIKDAEIHIKTFQKSSRSSINRAKKQMVTAERFHEKIVDQEPMEPIKPSCTSDILVKEARRISENNIEQVLSAKVGKKSEFYKNLHDSLSWGSGVSNGNTMLPAWCLTPVSIDLF